MLTKEQKMKMVSDAIDAGFTVELRKHEVEFDQLDEQIEIFLGLPVEMNCALEDEHTWASINREREFEDKFAATIHLA